MVVEKVERTREAGKQGQPPGEGERPRPALVLALSGSAATGQSWGRPPACFALSALCEFPQPL